ncbi:MAG: DMT family transporter [Patescibacteria group bacterium]|nr:DMT family transporter [Patescibacteria group bacterium]
MWLLFAFSGPVLWAASTHIDKYLVERYFKHSDTAVLMVFTAWIGLIMLPFIWWFQPAALYLPLASIAVMAASGILYMGAMLFYLQAIQSAEASVVAPLFQTSTIFTFALGYLVLGETLSWTNAAGAVLIIIGALLLSLDASFHFRAFRMRLLLLMLLCTFVLALSTVIFKYFAVREEFWSTTFWTYVGEALFGAGILAIPRYLKQFMLLLKTNTSALLAVNGANELINLGGGLGVRFASLLAPVALVSAVSSTTTLFVFIFGVLLTIFLPGLAQEDLSWANLLQKGAAALLVAVGVVLANI